MWEYLLLEAKKKHVGTWDDSYGFITDVLEVEWAHDIKIDVDGLVDFDVTCHLCVWMPKQGDILTCKISSMVEEAFLSEPFPWLKILVSERPPPDSKIGDGVSIAVCQVEKHKAAVYVTGTINH